MDKVEEHIVCWKKILYKTLTDAELAAAQLWADKQKNLMPYKCPACPFFHVTKREWTISRIEWLYHEEKERKKWVR